ncbi:MAG: zinc ribbon domain-containing protein [Anaerolineales bacterium]
MPIFEFVCTECDQPFEDLVFGSNTDGVLCPACGSEQVRKKMSTFASKIGSDGASLSIGNSSTASCSTGSV